MAAQAWAVARRASWAAGATVAHREARHLAPALALGGVLAEPLVAATDLPVAATSAMDGWAVAGVGPWRLASGWVGPGVQGSALAEGHALPIATGGVLPAGARAVLRRERGTLAGDVLAGVVADGTDVRPRGQECKAGDEVLPAGSVVTPAVVGLAAAAGRASLTVVARPRCEVLVLGGEFLGGPAAEPDALGPLLTAWLPGLGAELIGVQHPGDDPAVLADALRASTADVVITTGGTAAGPTDHLRPVLAGAGADLLVDGVAVRPGRPMLLARLSTGVLVVGLPGNPLAAASGVATLVMPLLDRLSGRRSEPPVTREVAGPVTTHPSDTRLVPVLGRELLHFAGPAMLRGLAAADGLAVVPPGSDTEPPAATTTRRLEVLSLRW